MRAPFTLLMALGMAALFFVSGCVATVEKDQALVDAPIDGAADVVSKNVGLDAGEDRAPRILAMGDSMMAWNNLTGQSIPHTIEDVLEEPVFNSAISGARVLYNLPLTGAMGMKIESQYRKGDWDWVVLNGGGNDLWLGCGCGKCTGKMEKMISADGKRGAIPMMVQELRHKGAQVAWVGYLRSPGAWSPVEGCKSTGNELEQRIQKLAALDAGVHYVSMAGLVPHGDRSFHGIDMIHPSIKGSREVGKRVAAVIAEHDPVLAQ